MEDLAEMARKLRRNALRLGYFDAAERFLGGWKLCLSAGRPTAADDAQAEATMRKTFGEEFVRKHKEVGPKTDPLDRLLVHWHLSAAWHRGVAPNEHERRQLDTMVVALGVPEDARRGEQLVTGAPVQVTHWRWKESPGGTKS